NPLHRRLVIHVTRCAVTCDSGGRNRRIMLMQFFIIGLGNEAHVIVEEMDFLLITHADVGMSAQKIVQRCCAGFLRASQNEIEPLNFATLRSEHRCNVLEILAWPSILFREAFEVRSVLPSLFAGGARLAESNTST